MRLFVKMGALHEHLCRLGCSVRHGVAVGLLLLVAFRNKLIL